MEEAEKESGCREYYYKISDVLTIMVCGMLRNYRAYPTYAWSDEASFCLGRKVVEEKTNEISAILKLLYAINIKGNIVTIDAMGTQTKIAEKIRKNKADYVLALKNNQHNLYKDVEDYFEDKEFRKAIEKVGGYKKTVEKAHSQTEIRECYQTEKINWLEDRTKWKGLKSIGMIQKTTIKDTKLCKGKRYYISS